MDKTSYKNALLKQRLQQDSDEEKGSARSHMSELGDSDVEINGGDFEDNNEIFKLKSRKKKAEDPMDSSDYGGEYEEDMSEDYMNDSSSEADEEEDEDKLAMNTSFTGGYMPNTDLRRVDRGMNPQFQGIICT
jgi:hypothetical protein